MFVIGGIQKTTLIDFPKKVAAIVFTQGCNFRCGYCHNAELIGCSRCSNISRQDFFEFLKSRQNKLDGVVITGGEPTIQSELYDFVKEIKSLDFAVKLDTNGTNPKILSTLIEDNLLDYIAMDIKAPIEKYSQVSGAKVDCENIKKSIDIIMKSGVDYEFRTTVLRSQLSFDDFDKIGQLINGAELYYLQKFVSSKIYNPKLACEASYSDEELMKLCKILNKYIKTVEYR